MSEARLQEMQEELRFYAEQKARDDQSYRALQAEHKDDLEQLAIVSTRSTHLFDSDGATGVQQQRQPGFECNFVSHNATIRMSSTTTGSCVKDGQTNDCSSLPSADDNLAILNGAAR
eukprot:s993_g10.t1